MSPKKHPPEQIINKLREAEVELAKGAFEVSAECVDGEVSPILIRSLAGNDWLAPPPSFREACASWRSRSPAADKHCSAPPGA